MAGQKPKDPMKPPISQTPGTGPSDLPPEARRGVGDFYRRVSQRPDTRKLLKKLASH